jgi:hypothetical protein
MKLISLVGHWIWKAIEFCGEWLLKFVEGIIKNVAEKQFLPLILKLAPTIFSIWLGGKAIESTVSTVANIVSPSAVVAPVKDTTRYVKLSDALSLAAQIVDNNSTLERKRDSLREHDQQLKDKRSQAILDSISAKYDRLLSITTANATLNIHGQATKNDSGTFSNNWVRLKVVSSNVIDFTLLARLKYVDMKMMNREGRTVNLITAYLASLVDSTDTIPLSIEQIINQEPPPLPADISKCWIDPALSGAVFFGREMTVGLAYSPFLISSGGREPKAVIIRYPFISVSTNLKTSTPITLGIAVNAAHWLWLLKDLYIVPSYGLDLKSGTRGVHLGVSTTL